MGPDQYDPTQAAFNFPADHGQFDFPNAHSPALSQLELSGNSSWSESHQGRRGGGVTGFGGGFGEFNEYGAASNFPGPFYPDYLRSLGVNIGGWDYGGRFGNGNNVVEQKPVINRNGGGISVGQAGQR